MALSEMHQETQRSTKTGSISDKQGGRMRASIHRFFFFLAFSVFRSRELVWNWVWNNTFLNLKTWHLTKDHISHQKGRGFVFFFFPGTFKRGICCLCLEGKASFFQIIEEFHKITKESRVFKWSTLGTAVSRGFTIPKDLRVPRISWVPC